MRISFTLVTFGPRLVDGGFLAELLRQVIESLQPTDLVEEPLLVALLRPLQVAPGVVNVLHGAEESNFKLVDVDVVATLQQNNQNPAKPKC